MPTRNNRGGVSKPGSHLPSKSVPRQDSPRANDTKNRTLHHAAQTEWTWENMPDIIYQLKPEGKSNRNEEPPMLPYRIHNNDVRDLPILPDNISSTVEEFRVEAWMRLDRRIRLRDITDRIHPDFRLRENALQQRGVRFRQAFGLLAWDSGNKRSLKLEEKLLAKMKNLGLDPRLNSTRGITPGLINPKAGEEGGRVPLPVGWGPNKSSRTKKVQCIEAELLKETLTGVEPSKSRADLPKPKEPTPDPDPSGFEEYMRSIEESLPEDLVEDAESLKPMEYELNSEASLSEETQSCDPVPQIKYTPEYIIADEDLPTSVSMADLDLTKGVTQPEPELKLRYPLVDDNFNPQSPFWSSSSVISTRGFCSSTCFNDAPQQPDELLKAIHIQPPFCSQSTPQTPSTDGFHFINPSDLDTVKQQAEMNGYDNMFNEYYSAERQLNEMPHYHSFALW
ncbi:hypothetical protein BJX68DRAFT_264568 [Aspergillus pseudodeflectus]|uniref:Clr5 domain-containing protein n=1 Tax=Aspergillus pseudodeflectus TaxID=176178 RepID=A0ABR4KTT3_9EURO